MIPPRLIAYGLAGLAAAGSLWWVAHTVSQWRAAYQERPALIAERDAAIAARTTAETDLTRQAQQNQEIERVLTDRLVSADARARDLARRLLQAGRPARPDCPAPAATGSDDGTRRDTERDRAIEEATGDLIAAADRDAARLTGLQEYVRGLPQRCAAE